MLPASPLGLTALAPGKVDGAGTVAANNWNNLPLENPDANTYGPDDLVDNSGAQAVSMSLYQDGHDRRHADVGGDPSDPNLNLYASPAPAVFRDNGGSIGGGDPNTLLTGLQAEFPHGYDVIINVAKWSFSEDWGSTSYVRVYNGAEGTGETEIANLSLVINQPSYNSATCFVPGQNYVKLSGLIWDTLDLRPFAVGNISFDEWNSIQITGVQILGLAPGEIDPITNVVDNLDFDYFEWSGAISVGTSTDAWRTKSAGAYSYKGQDGTYCTWNTPDLAFEGTETEYNVYTWVAAEPLLDTSAEYTVRYANGEEWTAVLNQSALGTGTWVLLGTFPFLGDGTEYVRITSGATGSRYTSYDAVMWEWAPPEAPVEVVPEPAGLGLIGLALLGVRRRRG